MSSMKEPPKWTQALYQDSFIEHLEQGGHGLLRHFCLGDSRFLPFHLFFFRDFRQVEHKVKILFLIWNLQVSHFTLQGWSRGKAFLGGAVLLEQTLLVVRDLRGGGS